MGDSVKAFRVGDAIFGNAGLKQGCYAEYAAMSENAVLSLKPSNISWEEAAPVCAAMTAWNFLAVLAKIKAGQKVLINGASGAVGSAAVQVAMHFGAQVTGVCSTRNMELVKSLGADRVIDYSADDFTENGQAYDIIFDVAGKRTFSQCKNSLVASGVYLNTVLKPSLLLQKFWTGLFDGKKAMFSATGLQSAPKQRKMLKEIVALFETGRLKTVIDRSCPLEETAEAHRYVESGRKRGNVVVTFPE